MIYTTHIIDTIVIIVIIDIIDIIDVIVEYQPKHDF